MASKSIGAPIGNTNGRTGKVFADAIRRAIRENCDGEDFEAKVATLCKQLVLTAQAGDIQAIKEIGDRLDGKSQQRVDVEHGGVVTHEHFGLPDLVGRADELLERHRPSAPSLPN